MPGYAVSKVGSKLNSVLCMKCRKIPFDSQHVTTPCSFALVHLGSTPFFMRCSLTPSLLPLLI